MLGAMTTMPRGTVAVAVLGVTAVTAYAVLAALQMLVFTPLSIAPARTLAEIRAEMAAAGESLGGGGVGLILGIGVAASIVIAVSSIRSRMRAMPTALLQLALLVAGAPAFFIASFGPGMALADTYYVSAGITLPGVVPFYVVSAVAFVAVIVLALGMLAFDRRAQVAPAR